MYKPLLDGLMARGLHVKIKLVFGTEDEGEDGKVSGAVYSLTEDALEPCTDEAFEK